VSSQSFCVQLSRVTLVGTCRKRDCAGRRGWENDLRISQAVGAESRFSITCSQPGQMRSSVGHGALPASGLASGAANRYICHAEWDKPTPTIPDCNPVGGDPVWRIKCTARSRIPCCAFLGSVSLSRKEPGFAWIRFSTETLPWSYAFRRMRTNQ
jgi:hypothetical protein